MVGSVREAVVGDVGGAERGEAAGTKGLTTERGGGEDAREQTEPRRRALKTRAERVVEGRAQQRRAGRLREDPAVGIARVVEQKSETKQPNGAA